MNALFTVRPTCVDLVDGQLLCVVCGDIGNGLHFGVITCEGCKVGCATSSYLDKQGVTKYITSSVIQVQLILHVSHALVALRSSSL